MLEDELAGKEHAVRKIFSNFLCKLCELFDRIGAEPDLKPETMSPSGLMAKPTLLSGVTNIRVLRYSSTAYARTDAPYLFDIFALLIASWKRSLPSAVRA
jgi:hypothetical protein